MAVCEQASGGQARAGSLSSLSLAAPRRLARATCGAPAPVSTPPKSCNRQPWTMTADNPLDKSRTAPAVRLIGLPTDSHSSFLRGAAAAPPLIRAALGSAHSHMAAASGVAIGVETGRAPD